MDELEARVAEIVQLRKGKTPPPPIGRPPKKPRVDEDVITDLAEIGCTMSELEKLTGLSEDTLHRRFAGAIEKGQATLNMSLRRKQVRRALEGSDTMLIWLGKQRLGQKDKNLTEHTGADGGPIVYDIADKTDAELIAEAEAITREAAKARSDTRRAAKKA